MHQVKKIIVSCNEHFELNWVKSIEKLNLSINQNQFRVVNVLQIYTCRIDVAL